MSGEKQSYPLRAYGAPALTDTDYYKISKEQICKITDLECQMASHEKSYKKIIDEKTSKIQELQNLRKSDRHHIDNLYLQIHKEILRNDPLKKKPKKDKIPDGFCVAPASLCLPTSYMNKLGL